MSKNKPITITYPLEFTCHHIGRDVVDECSYPKCKKKANILLRDGRSDYFIPFCSGCKLRWEMFDNPKIPAKMNRIRKRLELEEKKK